MGAGLDTLGRRLDALAAGLDGFAGRLGGVLRCFCCLCSLPSGLPYPFRFPDGLGGTPGAGGLPAANGTHPVILPNCVAGGRIVRLLWYAVRTRTSLFLPCATHRFAGKPLTPVNSFLGDILSASFNTVLRVLAAVLTGRFFFFSGLPRLPARAQYAALGKAAGLCQIAVSPFWRAVFALGLDFFFFQG